MTQVETPDHAIVVCDDALEDPEGCRAMALGLPYQSFTLGLATFHGIALAPPTVSQMIEAMDPRRKPSLSFFRRSPRGQAEPNYIHSDRSMGAWTALLYLTKDARDDDGTVFWEHESGERFDTSETVDTYAINGLRWLETDRWTPWFTVAAKFNRLVLFDAPYYHSRAIRENYGEGDSARLVNVTFGDWLCQ